MNLDIVIITALTIIPAVATGILTVFIMNARTNKRLQAYRVYAQTKLQSKLKLMQFQITAMKAQINASTKAFEVLRSENLRIKKMHLVFQEEEAARAKPLLTNVLDILDRVNSGFKYTQSHFADTQPYFADTDVMQR